MDIIHFIMLYTADHTFNNNPSVLSFFLLLHTFYFFATYISFDFLLMFR